MASSPAPTSTSRPGSRWAPWRPESADVGLVFATLDRVTDGDPQSWFDAWTATATTLAARGDAAAGIPFRYDWEAVLTPVIDALVARPDVDAARLTGYGISQAGYWLPRALAFEHRLVAAVADPGVVDVSTSWTGHLPPELIEVLHAGQKEVFNGIMRQVDADPAMARTMAFRSRPYGITDAFDVFTEVEKYHLRDVAGQIRTPLLITNPQDEQFWSGQSQQLYDLLPGTKEIVEFTRDEGANLHCQPMGRQLTHQRMFDWLEDRLA